MTTTKQYAKSLQEVADILDMTREQITRRYASRPGFPKKTARGYDVAAVGDFVAKDRKRHVSGDGSLRDKKLMVEIEILEAKRDEIRRTLIPLDEHMAELQQFHQIGVSVMDQWISVVSSVTKDAAAVHAAENLRQSCIEQWRDRVGKLNEA